MLRNKTVLKIFSLFAAILLWVYVMGEVDPETKEVIREIPITFINTEALEERGLAVVQEEEIYVNATVEGKRSDVNDVKKSGLTAYIDVSQCSKGKNTEKVNIIMPDGVSLEAVSESSVKFKVEKLMEAERPVEIEFTDTVSGGDKTAWILESEPEYITVSGAKSSVEKIAALKGEVSANKAETDKSRWVNVSVAPVTEEGDKVLGVNAGYNTVKVRIQLLSVKTAQLTVVTKNAEDGYTVSDVDVPERVRIIGPADTVAELEEIVGTVDLAGITGVAAAEVMLQLPEDVFLLDEKAVPMAEITMKSTE